MSDVSYEAILNLMRVYHPDWSEEGRQYTARIVYQDMMASGATMEDYRREPWVIESGAEKDYGDYESNQQSQTPWGVAMAAAKQYYSGASVDDATLQSLASIFLGYYNAGVTSPSAMISRYSKDSGLTQSSGPTSDDGISPYQQSELDQRNKEWLAEQERWRQELQWQQQQAQQEAERLRQQAEFERQANTWSTYTDAGGVWKRNGLGEVVRVGEVPRGEVQNMPSTWSGWGTEWTASDQYNPNTQRMDSVYNKTPMSWEAVNAQGQWANLPSNWYNVALNNRTLPTNEQQYNTYVSDTVGRLVGAKQGADQRYDLQSGQDATGVTPAGWYDTSQNSNAWQQGYGPDKGGTGTGEGGGYLTYVPSFQDYTGWNQTQRDQMEGWLNSGLSGYTQAQDYWDKMNRLRAPSGYQGLSYR